MVSFSALMLLINVGKDFPYLLPSIQPGADPGVQAVSPQVTISHPPGGRLPLLSARLAVTFPAAEHRRLVAVTMVTSMGSFYLFKKSHSYVLT